MTTDTKYYIWLTQALGYSSPKFMALYKLYDSMEAFYLGGEAEWRLSGVLSGKDIDALSSCDLSIAYDILSQCNRQGYTVVSMEDPAYPKRLFEIYDPPAVLYIWGRLPDFEHLLSIGMVGTRNATAYGKTAAHILAGSLAKIGVVIVSGGAVGIDSECHTGALEADGVTVAVLGCGLSHRYLMHQYPMREAISQRGAVISEYPPEYPASKFTFPERNRIISGLSNGIVVIEAGERSGSLITARLAMEQNRDVFAVMGNITSPYSQGTNRLIKDGAIPVTGYQDITDYYPQYQVTSTEERMIAKIPKHRADIDVSDNARKVYAVITAEPQHIDVITEKAGIPVNAVLQCMTELELEGLIAADAGRMYKLI